VGKTLLMQQLAVASSLPFDHCGPRDWVGVIPEHGPVLFVTAEDDEDELHYRYDCIAKFYGVRFRDLESRLHIMSLAGKDAVMAVVDAHGIVKPTELFARLVRTAKELRPSWIGLDTVADIFIVDERNRSEVRQCLSLCRGVCLEVDTAVVLLSHPSLVGISSGTGLSGSTAWSNSVRSRLYLKMPKRKKDGDDEEEEDSGVRVLETMKANYGPLGEPVRLAWKNGLLLPEAGPTSLEKLSQDADAQAIFLSLLQRYNQQDLTVSANPSARNFAPKIFAAMAEAKTLHGQESTRKRLLRDALDYLLAKGRIMAGTGPKTLPKSKQSPCLYAGGTLL
jgi:RecA-family ATPase